MIWQNKYNDLQVQYFKNNSELLLKVLLEIGEEQSLIQFFIKFLIASIQDFSLYSYYKPILNQILNNDPFAQSIRNQFLNKIFWIVSENVNDKVCLILKEICWPELSRFLLENYEKVKPFVQQFPSVIQIYEEQKSQESLVMVFSQNNFDNMILKIQQISKQFQDFNEEHLQYVDNLLIKLLLRVDNSNVLNEIVKLYSVKQYLQKINVDRFLKALLTKLNKVSLKEKHLDLYQKGDQLSQFILFLHLYQIKQIKTRNSNGVVKQNRFQSLPDLIKQLVSQYLNDGLLKQLSVFMQSELEVEVQFQILSENRQLLDNINFLPLLKQAKSQQQLTILLQSNQLETLDIFKQYLDTIDNQLQFLIDMIQYDNSPINFKLIAFMSKFLREQDNNNLMIMLIVKSLIIISNSNRIQKFAFINVIRFLKKNCKSFEWQNYTYDQLKDLQLAIKNHKQEIAHENITLKQLVQDLNLTQQINTLIDYLISIQNIDEMNQLIFIFDIKNRQQILAKQLEKNYHQMIFQNYINNIELNDDNIQFIKKFNQNQGFKQIVQEKIQKFNQFNNLNQDNQIYLLEIYNNFDLEISVQTLSILIQKQQQFVLRYIQHNQLKSEQIQEIIIKSMQTVNDDELLLQHLDILVFQDKVLNLKYINGLQLSLDEPIQIQMIYRIFQIYLKSQKSKFISLKLQSFKVNPQLFDLIKFILQQSNQKNNYVTIVAQTLQQLKSKDNIIQMLNCFEQNHILLIQMINQCYQNEFDQKYFDLIANSILTLKTKKLIKLISNSFQFLQQIVMKDKKFRQLARKLNLVKMQLRFVMRSFVILVKSILQKYKFQQEFINQVDLNSDIIISLSLLFQKSFEFEHTIVNSKLQTKIKFVKQLQSYSKFLIDFFPFEILVLVLTQQIKNDKLDLNIKSKFLEHFKVTHNKNISHLGQELLDQLKFENPNKIEINYIQKIINVLASIMKKKNSLQSQKIIESLFPLLNQKIGFQVKSQIIYILSFQSKKNQDLFIPVIKDMVSQSIKILLKQEQSSREILKQSLILLINNLEGLMSPYIIDIINGIIDINDYDEVFELIGLKQETRIMVPIINQIKQVDKQPQMIKVTILLNSICQKLDGEDFETYHNQIFKLLLNIIDYPRIIINQENLDVKNLELKIINTFETFILKTNKVILRKLFLQLFHWSNKSQKPTESGFLFTNYRKIILYKLMLSLIQKMQSLFVPFYSYVLEDIQSFISQILQQNQTNSKKNQKRKFKECDTYYQLENQLLNLIIQNLEKLFQFDKEQFIDNQKFEILAKSIPDLIEIQNQPEINYDAFMDQKLTPCLIQLFQQSNDDYKWKTLNYNILSKTKSDNDLIVIAVLKFLQRLIDFLKDRYAVLIQDMLPFLAETLEHENVQIEKISKSIVIQLEQVTGENISDYLKQ